MFFLQWYEKNVEYFQVYTIVLKNVFIKQVEGHNIKSSTKALLYWSFGYAVEI